ncbi:hypothetical protein WN51_10816 [Melipona quadrifasciata]|uniref:Uncharacterized protein n=1 Tax=Melipona quadrifasciata TaxID=166423 RepID=A0A0M9A4B1_9HYME|nr:hypothetical protein WN51_10816 [Melipona quadrifasciata]
MARKTFPNQEPRMLLVAGQANRCFALVPHAALIAELCPSRANCAWEGHNPRLGERGLNPARTSGPTIRANRDPNFRWRIILEKLTKTEDRDRDRSINAEQSHLARLFQSVQAVPPWPTNSTGSDEETSSSELNPSDAILDSDNASYRALEIAAKCRNVLRHADENDDCTDNDEKLSINLN